MGNNNKTQKDLLRKEKEKEIKKMKKNKGSASSTATNGEEEEEGGGGGGGDIWAFEAAPAQTKKKNKPAHAADGVVLGLDGGTTSTVCVCIPAKISSSSSSSFKAAKVPILSRSVAGCSNHNSVGEAEARDTLEKVMAQVLSKAGYTRSVVKAVCLSLSGVNHPSDQDRVLGWLRDIFPSHVMLYVDNDAVAALASGTTGKLHGCVLIVGTGSIAYGFTEDGREARAAGAGPVLGDWGSGYGIAAQALTAVIKAYDGRGPETILTNNILKELGLPSPDELIGWTYADPSWARIAALVPVVVSSAEVGDEVANRILHRSVQELADGVKAVVQRLELCGKDGRDHFPLVLVGGVLNAKKSWDIGKEVISRISNVYPGVQAIRPEVEPAVGAAMVAWTRYVRESGKKQPQKEGDSVN